MAYLLDIVAPGVGHLTDRRWFSGLVILLLWVVGLIATSLATSFNVHLIYVVLTVHPLLAMLSIGHLWWCRRREESKPSAWLWSLALVPFIGAAFVVGALFFSSAVLRPVRIRSGSMSPSVVTGDVVLVQMFGPRLRGIGLGDIVLIVHPRQEGRLLVKRILGLAGDLMQIRGGELLRNGRRLSQCELRSLRDHETRQRVIERLEVLDGRPYLVWDRPAIRSRSMDVRVPPGHLFVVGDNRDRSGDSRSFGSVPVTHVRGLVTVRIVPVLTNDVYQAPLGARREAYRRCSENQ